jgi:hypothetical protein
MKIRQPVHFEINQKPFLQIQFPYGEIHPFQTQFYPGRPGIAMEVNDVIKAFLPQNPYGCPQIAVKEVNIVYIRICLQNGYKCSFGKKMHPAVFNLIFQVAHDRSGQHDITYGTESDDQEFYHLNQVLKEKQKCQPVF